MLEPTSFSDFVVIVLSSAGASAVLITAMGWLLRTWIAERLTARVRHDYARKLAELNAQLKLQTDTSSLQLKADLDRIADRLKHSVQTSGEFHKATIERRLTAVEEVWAAVLRAESALPAVFFILDVLLDSEYESALTNPKTASEFKAIDHFKIISEALNSFKNVAQRRPFAGSYLWALSATYRSTVFRMIYLVSEARNQPAKIHWYSDDLLRKHIRAGLGADALTNFDAQRTGRVTWVRDHFSKAVLDAIDVVVAGREAGESALRQAERMEELLTASRDRLTSG